MLRNAHPDALFISVHTGEGLEQLVEQLAGLVDAGTQELLLHLPLDRSDILARLHREGTIHHANYEEEFIRIHASVSARLSETLKSYIVL